MIGRELDVFDLTFEVLQRSLTVSSDRDVEIVNREVEELVFSQVVSNAEKNCDQLRRARSEVIRRYQALINSKRNALAQLKGSYHLHVANCQQFEHALHRRVANQKNGSERRVRDLIFEVIGEYGKSNIRVLRRQEYLQKTGQTKIAFSVWKLLWQRFALRLKFELFQDIFAGKDVTPSLCNSLKNHFRCDHLSPDTDKDEVTYVLSKVAKKIGLLTERPLVVQSIIKVYKLVGRNKSGESLSSVPNQNFRLAATVRELKETVGIISNWVKKGVPEVGSPIAARPSSGGSRRAHSRTGQRKQQAAASTSASPVPLLKELLSSAWIRWLNPASFAPTLWNDIVASLSHGHGSSGSSISSTSHAGGSTSSCGCGDSEGDAMTEFVRRYHAQHSAALFSDRLYFCLEERSLSNCCAAVLAAGSTVGAGVTDGAHAAQLVGTGTAEDFLADDSISLNTTDKKVAVENATTMLLINTLQVTPTTFFSLFGLCACLRVRMCVCIYIHTCAYANTHTNQIKKTYKHINIYIYIYIYMPRFDVESLCMRLVLILCDLLECGEFTGGVCEPPQDALRALQRAAPWRICRRVAYEAEVPAAPTPASTWLRQHSPLPDSHRQRIQRAQIRARLPLVLPRCTASGGTQRCATALRACDDGASA